MTKISTPGRICLFGEHQDYLGLPVIAAAISRRVVVEGALRNDNQIIIHLPDIQSKLNFEISPSRLKYVKTRDYFRSAYNVLLDEGLTFSKGVECVVNGNIPINSGTSSSSALLVSWIHFLSKMADIPPMYSSQKLGELAFKAEVTEFGEPGGMMDHLSTAIGSAVYLTFQPTIEAQKIETNLGAFVLGDSCEPKDTIGVLKRAKFARLDLIEKIKKVDSEFSLHHFDSQKVDNFNSHLSDDEMVLLKGTLSNRDILREALDLFFNQSMSDDKFGELLLKHQEVLRDVLKISTNKIDRMLDFAMQAGAKGGKINGSGGGGCMFAYAPENPEKVAEAIERAGGKSYIIYIDKGTMELK